MHDQNQKRVNRAKKIKRFKASFWLVYTAVFALFYLFMFQVKLPSGLPDDFMHVMMVVLAGCCATITMIILGVVVGFFATVNK